jgi:hypothetical protein
MKNKIYKIGLIILTLALYFYINIAFSQSPEKSKTISETSCLGKTFFSKSVYEKTSYISPFILFNSNNIDCNIYPVQNNSSKSFNSSKYFEKYYNYAVLSLNPNYAIVIKLNFGNQDKVLANK